MTPTFRIIADDQDVTAALASRIIEITVQDNSGLKADRVHIELDDSPDEQGNVIIFPVEGTKLEVSLGYIKSPNQEFICPLIQVGVYFINEITAKKNKKGSTITIVGHAINQEGSFKEPRNIGYHNKKLGDIVTDCCKRNNMTPVIEKKYGDIKVAHIDQTNESDSGFLTRLYDIFGAIAKPINGRLLFGSPENIRTLLGDQSSSVPINAISMSEWRYISQTKGKFTAVRATWRDKDTGKDYTVSSQPSETHDQTYYTIPKTYGSKEEATEAASSRKEAFEKSQCSFNFTTLGNPQLVAGSKVDLFGMRRGIPTEWKLTKVEHKFNKEGFTTECDCDSKWAPDPGNTSTDSTGGSTGSTGDSIEPPLPVKADDPASTDETIPEVPDSGIPTEPDNLTNGEQGNPAITLQNAEVPSN